MRQKVDELIKIILCKFANLIKRIINSDCCYQAKLDLLECLADKMETFLNDD